MFYYLEDLDVYAYRLRLPKWAAFLMIFIFPATWPIGVYRFGSWIFKNSEIKILKILYVPYFILKRLTELFTGIQISHKAEIGSGFFIGHMGGIVINDSCIGKNASLHQNVTVGNAGRGEKHGNPTLGDGVYFGAGAAVIGKIQIGNNVMIGANAVVVKSAPDNVVLGGVPAEIINYKGSNDFVVFRGDGG